MTLHRMAEREDGLSLSELMPAGGVVGLVGHPGLGLTRIGLLLLAGRQRRGPVAYLDVRGWLCPTAAWDAGISPEELVVVRCGDPVQWGRVVSTLLEGVAAVYAEVPKGTRDTQLRTLAGLARSRRTPLVLRPLHGLLPPGITHLRLEARDVSWEGTDAGHGRLVSRRLVVEASGKAMRGMRRIIEVEDHGTDAVHLVPGLAVAPAGRAAS